MLPLLLFAFLPMEQLSETISTLVTLKVLPPDALLVVDPLLDSDIAPPFSQLPWTVTSWPEWAETSAPANGTVFPLFSSSM